MSELARIEAEVTFIPASEGGRATLPALASSVGKYMPHLVVGDPTQRHAITEGNVIKETYLGVAFLSSPDSVEFGKPFLAELGLLYYPHVAYDALLSGATFTIREGARVVGYGSVKKITLPERNSRD